MLLAVDQFPYYDKIEGNSNDSQAQAGERLAR
jgi:hypothetical protein